MWTPRDRVRMKNSSLSRYMDETTLPKQILIVEDEAAIREMYALKLSKEGYRVLQAENGDAALPLAMAKRPDLILLDVMMPQMSGFVLMKHLRADQEWGAKVPVIFLTNVDPNDEAAKYMKESVTPVSYLVKSQTTPDTLAMKVRTTLGWGKSLT